MNRNNIWVHVSLAVVLVTIAAVIGQVDRWRSALRTPDSASMSQITDRETDRHIQRSNGDPEVLVRFKPGRQSRNDPRDRRHNHDQVDDEIESVNGLVVIDDLDDADPQVGR